MSIVRLNDVAIDFDGVPVLREVFFKLAAGDRVGLIGNNGSGKSTVIKLIMDQETPTSGTVDVNLDTRIGYFSQFSELAGDQTVEEILDDVFVEVHEVEAELAAIDVAMAEGPDDDEMDRLVNAQAELFEKMEHLDGWSIQQKIDTVLTVLSFSPEDRARPVDQLSGGWRNRAALAKIVLTEPDVLLMDEPTNFLDVEGIEWLEQWFERFRGALLVVSHDRAFLDQVTTSIVEIENHRFHTYDGSFSQYVREKPFRMKAQESQFIGEQVLMILEAEGIADRARAKKAGKGVNRKLANVKKSATPKPVDEVVTDIYANLRVKNELCTVTSISKARDGNPLFTDLSFDVRRRDRLAIVGPNGCGKSTLIGALVGTDPADSGTVEWGRGVGVAHFNQILDDLDLSDTVSHAVNALPPGSLAREATRKQVKRFLTLFRFSEMDQSQKIGTLSGGQRARVALAQCLLSGASAIVLDEPTNHLDLPSTQVMERALHHFPGAVVVVSHDRFFIDKLATRIIDFAKF